MPSKRITYIAGIVLASLVVLPPVAGAFSVGVDADGINELKASGGTARYGQVWAGYWLKSSGYGEYEKDIRAARDAGATPVILWYYWGDAISVDAVKYGKDGHTKGDWDRMAKEIATRAKNQMGSKEFIIVLEPEFNKQGVQHWEDFDGMLANQASIIKAAAPNAKVVVGFGYWGGWDKFDRAMNKADYSGFQMMRASTRDSSAKAESMAADSVNVAKQLKAKFGKPVILFDLAVGSYGGWEGTQERAIKNFQAKRGELDAAGVKAVVYRYVRDNDNSKGYFGAAESSWGLKRSDGGHKAAWNDFVALSKNSGVASTSSSSSGGSSSGTTFSDVAIKEWWVQTKVESGKAITKVEARVNGGGWTTLDKQSWGAHAKSIHVPSGGKVEFRAWASDGSSTMSGAYALGGSPTSAPSSSTSTASSSGTKFSDVAVKEWWVQAKVESSKTITKVEARVNGGGWTTLDKQSWGAYAKSIHVPSGGKVEFRAWATDGISAMSGSYALGGSSSASTSSSSSGGVTFSGVQVKDWWVQTSTSGKSVTKVDARVNGGAWTTLAKQSWGAYAKSVNVKSGQSVEFRATATDGSTTTSGKYWR